MASPHTARIQEEESSSCLRTSSDPVRMARVKMNRKTSITKGMVYSNNIDRFSFPLSTSPDVQKVIDIKPLVIRKKSLMSVQDLNLQHRKSCIDESTSAEDNTQSNYGEPKKSVYVPSDEYSTKGPITSRSNIRRSSSPQLPLRNSIGRISHLFAKVTARRLSTPSLLNGNSKKVKEKHASVGWIDENDETKETPLVKASNNGNESLSKAKVDALKSKSTLVEQSTTSKNSLDPRLVITRRLSTPSLLNGNSKKVKEKRASVGWIDENDEAKETPLVKASNNGNESLNKAKVDALKSKSTSVEQTMTSKDSLDSRLVISVADPIETRRVYRKSNPIQINFSGHTLYSNYGYSPLKHNNFIFNNEYDGKQDMTPTLLNNGTDSGYASPTDQFLFEHMQNRNALLQSQWSERNEFPIPTRAFTKDLCVTEL